MLGISEGQDSRDFRYYDSSEMFLDGIDEALFVWRLSLAMYDSVLIRDYMFLYELYIRKDS